MKRSLPIILIFILAACCNAFGAADSLQLLHFTTENGLPSNNVYQVLQDHNGYLWFATDRGVVKYNGNSFKLFNTTNGLPTNDTWGLLEDKCGRILLYNSTSLAGYIRNDVYTKINLPSHTTLRTIGFGYQESATQVYFNFTNGTEAFIASLFPNDSVAVLHCPTDRISNYFMEGDTLWYYEGVNKLCGIDFAHPLQRIKPRRLPFPSADLITECRARFVRNGYAYYQTFDNQFMCVISPRRNSYFKLNVQELLENSEHLYATFIAQDSIRMFTNRNIYTVDSHYRVLRKDTIANEIPTQSQVTYRLRDADGNIWYGTTTDGVWCTLATHNILSKVQVPDSITENLYEGSSADGHLFFWNHSKRRVYDVVPGTNMHATEISGLGTLRSMTQYGDAEMLMAFSTGGAVYDMRNHSVQNLLDRYKYRINTDTDYLLSHTNMHHEEQIATEKHMPGSLIQFSTVAQDDIFCVSQVGLIEYQMRSDSIISSRIGLAKRFDNIAADHRGILWMHDKNLLAAYSANTHTYFYAQEQMLNGLGIDIINGFCLDGRGRLYFLCSNRIVIADIETLTLHNLPCYLNLNDATMSIRNDTLLIAGRFGIAAYNLSELHDGEFAIAPNIGIGAYKTLYTLIASPGLYMNTDKGMYTVAAAIMKAPKSARPWTDTFFKIRLEGGGLYKVRRGDTLRLSQTIAHLNIDVINFEGTGAPHYSFRIWGINADWEQNTTDELFLSGLKTGIYYPVTIIIKDDLWQSPPVTFYVYHWPYWYQTTTWKIIFWILGFIALGLVVLVSVLITRHYVARANERKRVLTELELRAVYSQINPHFIFNTLSSVQYFINKKNFDDAYLHVNKFSRLLRAYLKSSQDRYITLSEEIKMLTNYIELQKTRFETKFDYEIVVDNKLPADNIMIPSLLLQPLVENAINHGLFHKQGHGWLSVRFAQGADSSEVICTIEDNGVGRLKAKQINDENTTKRESYGTKLTQQLINIFNEFERMDIHLDYTDKQEPETGTTVRLTIKNVKYKV